MPPNGPKLAPGEVALLQRWATLEEQSPRPFPVQYDNDYALAAIRADVEKQAEPGRYRYVSLHDLVRDNLNDFTPLEPRRNALRDALPVKNALTPIDGTGTLFRLDLAALGWDTPRLHRMKVDAEVEVIDGPAVYNAYDLLLLEYPLGFVHPRQPDYAALAERYFPAARMVRPYPYLRGEWLIQTLPLLRDEMAGLNQGEAQPPKVAEPVPKITPITLTSNERDRPERILAIDGLLSPQLPESPNGLQVQFELLDALTGKPTRKLTPGEARFQIEVKTNEAIHIEIIWVYADGTINLLTPEQDQRVVPDERFLSPKLGLSDDPGRERLILWASTSPLGGSKDRLYGTAAGYRRLIHRFDDKQLFEKSIVRPEFQRNAIVKKTIEFEIVRGKK